MNATIEHIFADVVTDIGDIEEIKNNFDMLSPYGMRVMIYGLASSIKLSGDANLRKLLIRLAASCIMAIIALDTEKKV